MEALLTSTAVVALAEIGDKTMLLAIVLAVGLDPWVRILSRRLHLRRGLAVLAIFVLAAAALVLFAFLVIPPLVSQIAQLARSIPRIADDLAQAGGPVEDLIGAGAIIRRLTGRLSPEARIAVAAFESVRESLREQLLSCSSGRELAERGFTADVELAAEVDVSQVVPVLRGEAFIASTAAGVVG